MMYTNWTASNHIEALLMDVQNLTKQVGTLYGQKHQLQEENEALRAQVSEIARGLKEPVIRDTLH